MADWTDERVMQLGVLRRLIRECQIINRANNITVRLGDIIALAEQLNDFEAFLIDDCVATRQAAKEARDVTNQ